MSQTLTSSAYPPWTFTLQVLACMPQLLHLLRAEGLHASKANRQQEAHVLRKAFSALGSNSCDDVPQISAIGNDQISMISGLELWREMYLFLGHICTTSCNQQTIKSCDREYPWSSTESFHQNNVGRSISFPTHPISLRERCRTPKLRAQLHMCRHQGWGPWTKSQGLESSTSCWSRSLVHFCQLSIQMLPQFPPAGDWEWSFTVWVEVTKKASKNNMLTGCGRSKVETLVISLHNTLCWHNPTRTFFRFFLSSTGVLSSSKLSFIDSLFAPGDIYKFHDLGTVHGSKIYRPIEGFGWSGTTCS